MARNRARYGLDLTEVMYEDSPYGWSKPRLLAKVGSLCPKKLCALAGVALLNRDSGYS